MRGVRATSEKCQPFFCNFVYFESIGEKICILFTNWEKNMHFPPIFYPLSIIFSPQPVIWPYFCPNSQTEKYTPLSLLNIFLSFFSLILPFFLYTSLLFLTLLLKSFPKVLQSFPIPGPGGGHTPLYTRDSFIKVTLTQNTKI